MPQDGVGEGIPAPRKLRVASARISDPTLNEAITVMVPTVPGNMCLVKMRSV